MRFLQYIPFLEKKGIAVDVHALLSDELLADRYDVGGYTSRALITSYWDRLRVLLNKRQYDAVWIEKEALPWWPSWLERFLLAGKPYILDYDDAVFHGYDLHPSRLVRQLMGRRLDRLMSGANLVIGGNDYLAKRARVAGANAVEVIPTVIDINRYHPYNCGSSAGMAIEKVLKIVWIGSASTTKYLEVLREPLQKLSKEKPFILRVIGAGHINLPGVEIEAIPWRETTEVKYIGECDIGIMPLLDSPWERGKCGYKLIQYMACSLPVVASDVGVNSQIVIQGKSGYLARSPADWVAALEALLDDETLRRNMGQVGRKRVEDLYCVQVTSGQMAHLLQVAAGRAIDLCAKDS
ncbi:hypothetical protein R82526_01084 [Ralstonia mannitolilytica]|uniref:glycosyltransferase family 4 protein n=1 Tax=Ralstonia mannitolilytica TaxID=105219 RepID=UPI0028F4E177|nr:glycosyltransferase family 4 protein [Ralstonia mannitolilytica]CAJ0681138.1 hypothetical protein R82526_01084 [Ralstonia mannitolilytica]